MSQDTISLCPDAKKLIIAKKAYGCVQKTYGYVQKAYGCVFCMTGKEQYVAQNIEYHFPQIRARAVCQMKRQTKNGITTLINDVILNGYNVIVIFATLCIIFGLLSPNFFTGNNAITVLRQISMLCIMCCGCSLAIIAGGIDLSCGSIASVSGVFWALSMYNYGLPQWAAILIALASGTLFGFINGLIITKTTMNPMIATLGTAMVLQGVAYLICNGGTPIYGLPADAKILGQGYLLNIPIPIYVMAFCLLIHAFLLYKTRLGRSMIAAGSNAEATRLSGINAQKVRLIAYTLSGLFTAIGGVILMSRVNSGQPKAGDEFTMNIITACVVGGVSLVGGEGNTLKLLFGCLIVGVINNGLTIVQVSEYWQMIARGGILIFAVAIDAISVMRAMKMKRTVKHTAVSRSMA